MTEQDDYIAQLKSLESSIQEYGMDYLDREKKSTKEKRLFAICYWTVLQDYLKRHGISQRRMSEEIGKQPSVIAQMVYRNTYPSLDTEKNFLNCLSNATMYGSPCNGAGSSMVRRENVITTFLSFDRIVTDSVLDRFAVMERNRESLLLKRLIARLKELDAGGLERVSDFVFSL